LAKISERTCCIMKNLFLFAASSIAITQSSLAGQNFVDDFNSYANGNLAGTTADGLGQGTWRETGATATNPVQVNNGAVALGTSGQDIYSPLTSPITLTDGSSFYIGLTIDVSAAQATGDYFLHWTPTVGNTSIFQERLFVKSSGAGFVLGYATTSGGTTAYGSSVLNFGSSYQLVLAYNDVSGALNDTFSLYVNPTDLTTEANNTAYLNSGYVGTGSEQTTVAGINFRQGTAANAPTLTADNLVVGTTFADVTTVPEPSAVALGILGALAGLVAWKRRG
jgi:trimeric autotransporter adhesin